MKLPTPLIPITLWKRNLLTLFCLLLLCLTGSALGQQKPGALLRNGEMEGGGGSDGKGGGIPRWEAVDVGYDIDRNTHRGGDQAIRCDSLRPQTRRGAMQKVELNQTRPVPIVVTGWSKADQVSGAKDTDYSLYVDLEYTDGTPLWGQVAPFKVGTHDWERRQVLIAPAKPVKTMSVYALFRGHAGTAWFDDFEAHALDGAGIYDGQPLLPLPKRPTPAPGSRPGVTVTATDGLALTMNSQADITTLRAGGQDVSAPNSGGFYVRDVAKDGPLVPMRGAATVYQKTGVNFFSSPQNLGIRFYAKITPEGDTLSVDGELTDVTNTDRAVTVYLALPVGGEGWQWGRDVRKSEPIATGQEFSHLTHVNVGATGGMSLYPFGCVSNAQNGVGIAGQMDWPSVYRIFYNGATRQLVMAWDFALTGKTAAWPSHNARFRCRLFRLPPGQAEWGFRAAAQRFYKLNAPEFRRQAKAEGIWMPFTDPTKVERHEDFGFAYHEGDNSLQSDDALRILSFRYTEPMTWWMVMPPDLPRTYENAIAQLNQWALQPIKPGEKHPTPEEREMARATLNSGTQDENGRFNLEFRNEPWANGAVFVLNPNPELPSSPTKPTKASLSYTVAKAMATYSAAAKQSRGEQDGEYLDSLEGWSDTLDFRPSHLSASSYPIPFDVDSRKPCLPQWFSTHAFTRFLRDDLHNRGKLLMANSTPIRFSAFASLLDVMGIEVNWLDNKGQWQPDSDEVFNLRRTLSAQKPYLLLMNTDFDKLTSPYVEKYFQRSLFYGVYPSMFSADAATKPYWENPKWYNRDRPLFQKYIPLVKRLSSVGWEPVTWAKSANPSVSVERFGSRLFTVLNDSGQPNDSTLLIDLRGLGMQNAANVRVINLFTNAEMPAQRNVGMLSIPLHLNSEEALALELK